MGITSSVPLAEQSFVSGGADAIISGSFVVAAVLFLVFWGIRAAAGKVNFPAGSGHGRPDRSVSGEEAVPAAPGGGLPDSYSSPYSPPATLPPPLPIEPPAGIFGYLKVPISHYRPFDVFLIGLVFMIFFGLTAGPQGNDATPLEDKFRPDVLVASILFQLVLMGMVMAFVRWRISLTQWLGLKWKRWPFAFAIAPLAVFFTWCFMGALYVSGWNGWLERSLGIESMQEAVQVLQQAQDPLVIALMAVAAVIVAPIAEEVVFRGYLYPAARKFCGPIGGVLFSSLVFAAAHGNVVALLPLFVLAVLLCLIYEATGSIWANISVHFLFNAATVGLQLLARAGLVDMSTPQ